MIISTLACPFSKPNIQNQIYWIKFLPLGLKQIYQTKYKNSIYKAKCLKCKEQTTMNQNVPNQTFSVKSKIQSPPNQFFVPLGLNQIFQTYKVHETNSTESNT